MLVLEERVQQEEEEADAFMQQYDRAEAGRRRRDAARKFGHVVHPLTTGPCEYVSIVTTTGGRMLPVREPEIFVSFLGCLSVTYCYNV